MKPFQITMTLYLHAESEEEAESMADMILEDIEDISYSIDAVEPHEYEVTQ